MEEVGVAWAEFAGEWLDDPPCGDAVPDGVSFFLASLLPSRSLFRESCSCCQTPHINTRLFTHEWCMIRCIVHEGECILQHGKTYHSLPKTIHLVGLVVAANGGRIIDARVRSAGTVLLTRHKRGYMPLCSSRNRLGVCVVKG